MNTLWHLDVARMRAARSAPCGCKPCDGGCAPETPLNGIHYCAKHDCATHAKEALADAREGMESE